MFEADLPAVLLADESAHNGAFVASEDMAGDVVGDGEEDERMKEDAEARVGGLGG